MKARMRGSSSRRPGWRQLEFVALYLLAPWAGAVLTALDMMSARGLLLGFIALLAVSLVLLSMTPGFRWRSLLAGRLIADPLKALIFALTTAMVVLLLTLLLAPAALFQLPLQAPGLWLTVVVLYPLVSVLPQEIIYRALFFSRYGHLFRGRHRAIAVNALLFGLAHLFYMNWVAVLLTTIGGAVFAWAYLEKQSFLFALLLHALAGWVLFTTGLGEAYFFHGNIGWV